MGVGPRSLICRLCSRSWPRRCTDARPGRVTHKLLIIITYLPELIYRLIHMGEMRDNMGEIFWEKLWKLVYLYFLWVSVSQLLICLPDSMFIDYIFYFLWAELSQDLYILVPVYKETCCISHGRQCTASTYRKFCADCKARTDFQISGYMVE